MTQRIPFKLQTQHFLHVYRPPKTPGNSLTSLGSGVTTLVRHGRSYLAGDQRRQGGKPYLAGDQERQGDEPYLAGDQERQGGKPYLAGDQERQGDEPQTALHRGGSGNESHAVRTSRY